MDILVVFVGLVLILSIIWVFNFKINKSTKENDKLQRDIENFEQSIDREMRNLQRDIEEFEL